MNISDINKETWNEKLKSSPYQTPFHDAFLIDVFINELGGNYSLYCVENENKYWLVPVFYGEPWYRDVSVFATSAVGYGGPLPLHGITNINHEFIAIKKVIRFLEGYLQKSFNKGVLYPFIDWENMIDKSGETFIIDMGTDIDDTFSHILTGNARTAIRKAEKSGLIVKQPENKKELEEAYGLIINTQKLVSSSYMTPYSLLERFFKEKELPIKIYLALYKDIIVSVVVLLENEKHSFHWLHGWNRDYAKFCGNQFLIWFMIRSCIEKGCLKLNLGACHTEEQKKAKMRWGAKPRKILNLTSKEIKL
ncbi:GNAT family N-acetyltransferase [Microcoleus sp.]|uniref:GNAT family N-acetyltransferase n=1 Tax=Microcoleus sp. TaxID=44472 RepID=UPI003525B3F0